MTFRGLTASSFWLGLPVGAVNRTRLDKRMREQ
jgi:hypothetical protein